MKFIELPVIYTQNFDEYEKAKEQGIEVKTIDTIDMTTFIMPDDMLIRINPQSDNKRTTVRFYDDSYNIDADYETVRQMFKDALNVKIEREIK